MNQNEREMLMLTHVRRLLTGRKTITQADSMAGLKISASETIRLLDVVLGAAAPSWEKSGCEWREVYSVEDILEKCSRHESAARINR